MTSFTAREVRAWAISNDIECPRTGKIGQRIIDAYLAAVHPDALTLVSSLPEPVADDEGPMFRVTVEIPGDSAAGEEIANYILEAVYAAFESGRRVERSRMIEQLGGAA